MKKRNKIVMITGIVIGALILLVFAAGLYIESLADGIIAREFARMTHDRYRLTTEGVDVSLFNRSVTLAGISIAPNPAPHSDSIPLPTLPAGIVDFSARELFISGIRFNKRDEATNIKVGKLILRAPKIKLTKTPHTDRRDTTAVTPLRIAIGRIFIDEGYLEHSRQGRIDTLRNAVEGFELRTKKLFIDTGGGLAPSAIGNNTSLSITKITHMPEDESTRMEIDSIALETAAHTLRIASVSVIPTYTKTEFGYKSWGHKDWDSMSFSGISFHGIDFDRLLSDGQLHIDSAHLAHGDVSSYKNRNIERVEWIKPMHYQLIQQLPVRFSLRTLAIGSLDAQYEELRAGGDKAGTITFDEISGRIDNLGNIPAPDRPYSEWRLHTRLMNAGPLTVTGYMPIDSLNDRFELSAFLGRMDAAALNNMITPLANIAISSGTIDKIDMHIIGNSQRATIDMTFLYNGLKATILKEKDGKVKERGFLSGIVNSMIIINSNPFHGETRTAHRTVDRAPLHSPFNYLWHTVFEAAKETIGLGKL